MSKLSPEAVTEHRSWCAGPGTHADALEAARWHEGRKVVTRVKIPGNRSADRRPGFGRDVRYLTDSELDRFLASEGREAREWGGRSIVRVDGQHVATLGQGTRTRPVNRKRAQSRAGR